MSLSTIKILKTVNKHTLKKNKWNQQITQVA
jgi:hypothetical protein